MRDESMLTVDVAVASWPCWRCKQLGAVAVGMLVPDVGWVAVGELLCEAIGGDRLAGWRQAVGLGVVKPRWSRTAGRSYWSQGCPNCDALFGEFPLREEFIELHAAGVLESCIAGPIVLDAGVVWAALGFYGDPTD